MRKASLIVLFVFWIASVVLWGSVYLHRRGIYLLGWETYVIPKESIFRKERLGVNAYQSEVPAAFRDVVKESASQALIFEDGVPLPVYREDSVGRFRVGREGAGNFIIQNRQVLFSATDNSDPRTNAKSYDLRVPRPIGEETETRLGAAAILLGVCLLGLIFLTGNLRQAAKAGLIVGFNMILLSLLLASVEGFLRLTVHNEDNKEKLAGYRLPYDSNFARNDVTYYRPQEILDESGGLYTWGVLVANNSLGFREREIVTPKPEGLQRVMVLGDSLTFGIGLEVEERYTDLAEKYLQERLGSRVIEVLNFGKPGADLDDELEVLETYKDLVQPDLIVVGFCGNDFMASVDVYQVRRKQFESQYGAGINFISSVMRKAGLQITTLKFRAALDVFLIRSGILPDVDYASRQLLESDTPEGKHFLSVLRRIKQISDEMNLSPPIFMVLSVQPGLKRVSDYRDLSADLPIQLRLFHRAEQLSAQAGFEHFNFEQEIISHPPEQWTINEVDDHPSKALNLIYAEKLSSAIYSSLNENVQ